MNAQTQINEFTIGQPVLHSDMANNRTGWIAAIAGPPEGMTISIIGANGLEQQHHRLWIVWADCSYSMDVNEGIVRPWIKNAEDYGVAPMDAEDVAEALQAAKDKLAADRKAQAIAADKAAQRVSDWRDSIRDKIPANAKAVIVGELMQDKSDSMTDYFASSSTKTIILGFSTHTRDLFPEMRKAARNHESTAFLADAPSSAEHREKYSMGGGFYLKDGYRHNDGWRVCKQTFYNSRNSNDIAQNVPFGEWSVPEKAARPERTNTATSNTDAGGFTISEHTHTKRGFQMWIVSPKDRVSRDAFTELLATAKAAGGWYSRKWSSTPAGFAFKDQDAATTFAESAA